MSIERTFPNHLPPTVEGVSAHWGILESYRTSQKRGREFLHQRSTDNSHGCGLGQLQQPEKGSPVLNGQPGPAMVSLAFQTPSSSIHSVIQPISTQCPLEPGPVLGAGVLFICIKTDTILASTGRCKQVGKETKVRTQKITRVGGITVIHSANPQTFTRFIPCANHNS